MTQIQPHKKPLVFTVANRKGGVGKTTNSVNLAFAFGQLGYKVLIIDADPQGSLTQTLGIDRSIGSSPELTINNITKVSRELRGKEDVPYKIDDLFGNASDEELAPSTFVGLHELLIKAFDDDPISERDVDDAIVSPTYKIEKTKKELKELDQQGTISVSELGSSYYNYYKFGFDLICSSEELTDDELQISLNSEERVKNRKGLLMITVVQAISRYKDYDVILIDTGPSLGILTINALAAARDGIIVSVSADEQSLWSLQKFKFNIRQIKQMVLDHEGVLGVILSPYEARSTLAPIIADKIKNVLNLYLFDTKIPRSNNAAKATASGVLFSMIYQPAYDAYENLALEILDRCNKNHAWELERNKMVVEEMTKLKQSNPAFLTMSEREILKHVRDMYSDGELWDMPSSDFGNEEKGDEEIANGED